MFRKRLISWSLIFALTGTSVFGHCYNPEMVYAEEVTEELKAQPTAMEALEFLNLCDPQDFIHVTTSETQAAEMTAVISEVTQGLDGEYERAEAIYNWVAENISYESNPYVDISAEPYDVFTSKQGVCGGFSNLVKEMMNLAGIPSAAVVGYLYGNLPHQWNAVYVDGQWVYADATGKGYFNEANMPNTHMVKEIKDIALYADDLELGYYYGLAVTAASGNKVEIPDSFQGYPITAISYTLFGEQSNIEELKINANITQIDESTLKSYKKIKTITVAEENPVYASYEGALFTADYQQMIVYPYSSEATEFTLPKETMSFDLKEAFQASNLKNLYVEEGSSYFASYDGAIYDSAKTQLLSIPKGKTSLQVYENATIADSAFANVDKSNFTIIGLSGSPAEIYANENQIAFREATAEIVIDATEYGADPSGVRDSAEAIWQAFEAAKEASENGTKPVTVFFPKGEYHVYKDRAQQREYHTSNTSSTDAPYHNKHIGILIEDQKNLTIEGDGSLFMIHGDMMALAIVRSENVKLHNFAWDYAVPTVTEMTVVDMGTEGGTPYADFYIPQCFPYEIQGNTILWKSDVSPYTGETYWTRTGIHENSYSVVTHQPNEEMSRAYYTSQNPFQNLSSLKQLDENKVRIYYSSRPGVLNLGTIFQFCSSAVRPTAGAFTWESKDVTAEKVDVHYMDGFGWLIQMSENVYYKDCNLMPRDNSGHLTVSYADGIHASGAKGEIVIDNCNFAYTHDDPINLHGTFTRVEQRVDDYTLKLKYIHAQQGGFPQFHVGDKVQFFTRDTLESTDNETEYEVAEIISNPGEAGNDLKTMVVRFKEALPANLSDQIGYEPKYVAENVTYAPKVTITNCTFKNIVTRGILCTTRNKVLIENNIFYPTSMATIFLSNDSNDWYESGPIRDMTIRGNVFYVDDIGRTSWEYAPAIYVHPVTKGGGLPSANNPIHKNITIEDNEFYMDEDVVVYAESVENLTFRNNTVLRMNPDVTLTLNPDETTVNTGEAMSLNFQKRGNTNDDDDDSNGGRDNVFKFVKSKNVTISGNTYDDGLKRYVVTDADTLSTLNVTDGDLSIVNYENGAPSAAVGKVTFVNSNPDVLFVDDNGTVTGLKEGSATIYAYYEWNGTIIKSNEVTIQVSGEAVPEESDGKVTITTTSRNEDFSITREDESHYVMTNDSFTVDMQAGDLWQEYNTLKNLLLYEPTTADKADLRVMVRVTGMPVNEGGQWDTASFMLYKDDNNYITIGKKSHYNGFCYVVEANGSADERNGDSADNSVTSGYLGITNVGGTVTLSAKADGGVWKDVATITNHTVGTDYKIGFAGWETNDRSKSVTFSDFKIGTSQDAFETLEASETVGFYKEEKIAIEKNPVINTESHRSNHARIDSITIDELGFSKTASSESTLDKYYHMIAESGKSEVTLRVMKDAKSQEVKILHGDYRTELALKAEGNTYTTVAPVALRDGINTLYVRVYAEDGITYKQHILAITYTPDYVEKEIADGFVKEILFDGADVTKDCIVTGGFAKKVGKSKVQLKVTAQDGAKVTFGLEGTTLPEAVSSVMEGEVNLSQGEQRIKVVITMNGNEKIYYLNVEKAQYLSDLPWISASVGYGSGVNRDKNHNGNQIALTDENGNAVLFEKGLGIHAESVIIYDISELEYDVLKGYVGIDHCQYTAEYGDVRFIVLIDDVQVFDSGVMTKTTPMKALEIEIPEGAQKMELRALQGDNNWNDHANWAEMKFESYSTPEPVEYTVTFNVDGETTEVTVEEGEKVERPEDPSKEGYDFTGWTLDGNAYDFEEVVTGNITLVATWEIKEYTVTFDVDGETTTETVAYGETVAKPEDPEKEGYNFIGWYVGEEAYDFETEVTADLTITAKFEEIVTPDPDPTPEPDPVPPTQEEQVRAFVERMYTIILGRDADPNGLNDWAAGLIEWRVDGAGIVNGFANSEEFVARNLSDEDFIKTLYLAVLNREADENGLADWLRAFELGYTRQMLIDGFVTSAEFIALCESYGILAEITQRHLVTSFVERMYTVALDREADAAGLEYWVTKLMAGSTDGKTVVNGFVGSEEFEARGLNDEDFIKTLYRTILGREANEADVASWIAAIELGQTRTQIMNGFIESAEFAYLCDGYGISAILTQRDLVTNFVERMYTVALGREADENGLNDWVTGLIDGVIYGAQVADGFIMSAEFEARGLSNEDYIKTLYLTFFNREAGAADVEGWVAAMTVHGQSRRDVLRGFINAEEFRVLCEDYGIIRGELAN